MTKVKNLKKRTDELQEGLSELKMIVWKNANPPKFKVGDRVRYSKKAL